MMMRKPIVATRVPGIVDIVTHGNTALLVPPGDKESLAKATIWALVNVTEATRMGQRAKNVAIASFSQQILLNEMKSDPIRYVGF